MCRGLCWGDIVRSGRKWEYDIKMHLIQIKWEDVDWIHLAEDGAAAAAVCVCVCGVNKPLGSIKCR